MGKCTLRRKKTGLLVKHGTEELVSRAKSLHEEIALTFTYHLNSLRHRRQFVRIMQDSEA